MGMPKFHRTGADATRDATAASAPSNGEGKRSMNSPTRQASKAGSKKKAPAR
jgi:hypothetical protein